MEYIQMIWSNPYCMLIVGLILLVIAGDYLVDSASGIANYFKMPPLIIGMTVVAFGTSAPELLVSLTSGLQGSPAIAIGNVVGSNISNVSIIVGITALICPFAVLERSITRDTFFLLLLSIIMIVFGYVGAGLNRIEGIIMFVCLVAFIYKSIQEEKKNADETEKLEVKFKSLWVNIIVLVISLAGLSYGADLMVDGATNLARQWGWSERVIAVTIVAIGTSLPELTASIIAASKHQTDMVVGNIVGSNIFNIGCVLALTCTACPIELTGVGEVPSLNQYLNDSLWMFGFEIMLLIGMINVTGNVDKYKQTKKFASLFSTKDGLVGRIWGFCALLLYALYAYLLINKQ